MHSVALLLLSLFSQEDNGEQFYKFQVGTEWEYAQTDAEGDKTSVTTVVKNEEGKVTLESKDYKDKDRKELIKTETLILSVKDGILWIGGEGDQPMPPLPLYKLGSKKGDVWKWKMGEGEEAREIDVCNEGTSEVEVPAGKYKDVTTVEVKLGEMGSLKFYLAPKVGLIMGEFGENQTMKLTKFTPAK